MSQIKIENHQAVQLILTLRDGTHATTTRQRRATFSGIASALKSLRIISAKQSIIGLYEGLDRNGSHWFMAEAQDTTKVVELSLASRLQIDAERIARTALSNFLNTTCAVETELVRGGRTETELVEAIKQELIRYASTSK